MPPRGPVWLAPQIENRGRRQGALFALGQFGLQTPALADGMHEAVKTLKRTLDTQLCTVLRPEPARNCLPVWATPGWPRGADGLPEVPLNSNSQAGLSASSGLPVVVHDPESDSRLRWTRAFLLSRGVRSGASVAFGGEARVFGVRVAQARRPYCLKTNEVYFLQSVAMMLSAAVQRADVERRVDGTERLLLEAVEGVPDPFVVVGLDWRPRRDRPRQLRTVGELR